MHYDFSGYATKNDILCTDGRTIRQDAFKDNDGGSVPLVWQHRHDKPENVIGHADLENRDDGVYCYGVFNNTAAGKHAKEMVKNGDIKSLSIYANHLVEKDGNVMHGSIKEVSLVLAGANSGAFIDNISLQHADGDYISSSDEADIYFYDEQIVLCHEENQNGSEEIKPVLTQDEYDDIMATLDEIGEIIDGMEQESNGKVVNHSAFEDDDELALVHYASKYYDPVYAHEYYMKHRKLKGRGASTDVLTTDGKITAGYEKAAINREKKSNIDTANANAKAEGKKIKTESKEERKKINTKLKSDLKTNAEEAKTNIAKIREHFNERIKNEKGALQKQWLKSSKKTLIATLREDRNEAANCLLSAYKSDSADITEQKKTKDAALKVENTEKVTDYRIKAENDYAACIERLAKMKGYGKLATFTNSEITSYTNNGENIHVEAKNTEKHEGIFDDGTALYARNIGTYEQNGKNGYKETESGTGYLNYGVTSSAYNTKSGVINDEGTSVTIDPKKSKSNSYAYQKKVNHSDSDSSELFHEDDRTVKEIFDSLTEKQKKVAYYLIGKVMEGNSAEHSEEDTNTFDASNMDEDESNYIYHEDKNASDETVGEIFDTFTEEQQNVVYYMMAQAMEDKTLNHSDKGGNDTMKHNIFEAQEENTGYLTHADEGLLIEEAKKAGSLKDVVLAHAEAGDFLMHDASTTPTNHQYGFGPDGTWTNASGNISSLDGGYRTGLNYLWPDAQYANKKIELIRNNPSDWVAKVMSGVKKSPFSRLKTVMSDVTTDEARARGYVKGTQKVSEIVSLLKRTTSPTTIYKAQKLDRDDIIDITDFDIVAWLKAEMRIMLEEEFARAYLLGDFRLSTDSKKINEDCIRPVLKDYANDFYAVRHGYSVAASEDAYSKFVDECVLAMVDYEGTGTPTAFVAPDFLARLLLIKDSLGNRMYKTRAELASAMCVKDIVEIPYMKDKTMSDGEGGTIHTMDINATAAPSATSTSKIAVKGIILNLEDYTVGADKGGAVNMFDDFDIDFNQYKYLMESRCSGSLLKYHSAILIGDTVTRTA